MAFQFKYPRLAFSYHPESETCPARMMPDAGYIHRTSNSEKLHFLKVISERVQEEINKLQSKETN